MAESNRLRVLEQHRVNDIFCVWDVSEAMSANEKNSCCKASHHRTSARQVTMFCVNVLFFYIGATMFILPFQNKTRM